MDELLLHICCAPDSTVAIERLRDRFQLIGLFYNPNIEPEDEYALREAEARMFTALVGIPYEELTPSKEEWLEAVKPYPNEPERGLRCQACILHRLRKAAQFANQKGILYFTTTLTTSPHKDVDFIHRTGRQLAEEYQLIYLPETFRSRDGFRRSVDLSRQWGLYRQSYCGCRWSLKGQSSIISCSSSDSPSGR